MSDIYFDKNKNKNNADNGNTQNPSKYTPDGRTRRVDDTVYYSESDFEDFYSDSPKERKQDKRADNRDEYTPSRGQSHAPVGEGAKPVARPKKKKKHIFLKLIAALLVLVILVCGAGAAAAFSLMGELSFSEDGRHVNEFADKSTLMSSPTVKNILLIGVDSRSGDTYSRSDTMMLVSLNTLTHNITLISFMRDMYVDIPGEYATKINSSCAYGGPGLVVDTIECNFDIDIDNYILVNFDVFKTLVDGIGGIYVDVTEEEAEYMHGSLVKLPDMQSGEDIHLNGNEALWYARIRKLDSDFNRTERQRKVIKAILNKISKTAPTTLYSTAKEVLPEVVTDLTKKDLVSLCSSMPAYLLAGLDVTELRIPADDTWSYGTRNGSSVIIVDIDDNIDIIREAIYD